VAVAVAVAAEAAKRKPRLAMPLVFHS